jgi:hypothetical protein
VPLSDRELSRALLGADLLVDGGFHLRPLVLMTEDEVLGMNLAR